MEATGTFEVKLRRAEATPFETGMGVARYEFEKTWQGDLTGSSMGEMLASATESTGARAYVAMEHLTAKLGDKHGSFQLAHRASEVQGDTASAEMVIAVVKGSGTEQLAGMQGELAITVDSAGRHNYVLRYQLT